MALTEWQKAEIKVMAKKYLGKKNDEIACHTKDLRIDYRIEGQSLYIFEHRKTFSGAFEDFDVAKTTYVSTIKKWKLFWMMRDLKWHAYIDTFHDDIESVFKCIDKDELCAFWG